MVGIVRPTPGWPRARSWPWSSAAAARFGTRPNTAWDIAQTINRSRVRRERREFVCRHCANECLIQEFRVEDEKSYWGEGGKDQLHFQICRGKR